MDYTDFIIERCRALSENINNFFAEERYIAEVDQIEQVTPEFLRNRAVSMVISELDSIGLVTNYDSSEILTDRVELETMWYLRTAFDSRNYHLSIKALPQEQYTTYKGIVENTALSEDLLIEIGNFFHGLLPTDTMWEYVDRSTQQWASTDRLRDHITAIQDTLDNQRDTNTTPITSDNFDNIKEFLLYTQARSAQISEYVAGVVRRFPNDVVYPILQLYVDKYDHEKLHPDVIDVFAWYHVHKPETEPQCHIHHHTTVNHHHEYWQSIHNTAIKTNTPPTAHMDNNIATMVVGSMVLDDMPVEKIHKAIDRYFGGLYTIITPAQIAFMHSIADITVQPLVTESR